ncbi:hypothetical protein [Dawidia soli]|uniref:Uncharacterized protein n=1 Tax=Dawidia soli TaxID=2782352 RepID=A0AAP2DCA1_9BACT|nr:hypothetical protein [Dawidia soli]MBT1688727.1 hypothetical protein [Dawidia soli]
MKRILLVNMLFFMLSANAQIAFRDAKTVRERCVTVTHPNFAFKNDNASVDILAGLLKNYLPLAHRNNPALTTGQVLGAFTANPFFGAEISPLIAGGAGGNAVNMITSSVNKIGGLNVTTVADGIARFLVERTKAELDVYFFERFKEFLENTTYGNDLKVLFPNTHSVMLVVGSEIYNYQMYLQSLREAFAHDLSALLVNTNRWINQNPPGSVVTIIQGSALYPYLQLALQLAVDIQNGKHPGDILNDFAGRAYNNAVWGEFGPIVKVANLVSQSLRSDDPNRYWISEQDFGEFNDITFARLYFGLLYEKARELNVSINGTPLTNILASVAAHLNGGVQFVGELKPLLVQGDKIISEIRGQSERGIAENYVLLGSTILDVSEVTNRLLLTTAGATLFPAAVVDNAQFFFTHTANLLADVRTRSYSAGVIELSLILQKISVDPNLVNGVIKYGTFMAGVAVAKTSEEVKQAIEVVALPPGSYRVKRESRANISLNAYMGFYGGNEHMPQSENKDSFSAGLFAPVGFAFSRGAMKNNEKKGGKSISIFASVIDVGTLAAFRFKDDNTTVSSEIQLEDIVAPGLFFVYGLGKSPISIGAGVQMGPALRDVNPNGVADIHKDYYVRAGGFIAVDIPVFNLYNRKDKKTK